MKAITNEKKKAIKIKITEEQERKQESTSECSKEAITNERKQTKENNRNTERRRKQ